MNNTLAVVEKAGNLTIAEEDVLRSRLAEMEEALEKEQSNERAIEDKIKVRGSRVGIIFLEQGVFAKQISGENNEQQTHKCVV